MSEPKAGIHSLGHPDSTEISFRCYLDLKALLLSFFSKGWQEGRGQKSEHAFQIIHVDPMPCLLQAMQFDLSLSPCLKGPEPC